MLTMKAIKMGSAPSDGRKKARQAPFAMRRLGVVAILFAFSSGGIVELGQAVVKAQAPLSGTYENTASDLGRGAIEEGVDHGLSKAGRIIRGIARQRLLKNNPPVRRLEIRLSEDESRIDYDDSRSYRGPIGVGDPQSCRSPDGGKVDVHYTWDRATLIEIAETREGSARIHYTLEGDRLRVETHIESRFLPAPIRFTLYFRRL